MKKSKILKSFLKQKQGFDRETVCERITSGLQTIMDLAIAELFNQPVDLIAFPDYAVKIGYPIDLNTIKERVSNRYYRRLEAIEWDVKKIEENAFQYNEPESAIVKQATLLTNVLIEFINDMDCLNPRPIYKRLNKDQGLNETQASPNLSRRRQRKARVETQTTTSNFRFNLRSRQNVEESNQGEPETVSNGTFSWRDEAIKLLSSIMKHPDSMPFRQLVDTNEYPDYTDKIENPIDFGTIRQRLNYNIYTNRDFNLFDKDCKR